VLNDPALNLLVHTTPIQKAETPYYHWHIEIMPKLTHTAGFEWGTGCYINPIPPERAAELLNNGNGQDKK
jgi:UDPglucose--hexose-1-phosphate uridylyltransferase